MSKARTNGWVLTLMCLGEFLVVMDTAIVDVALPAIGRSLGFPGADLAWIVNAYTITFAGFLLLAGRAGDLFGRRRIFLSGLVVFAVASLTGGLAVDPAMLIVARAVQGVAAGVLAATSLSIVLSTFTEPAARARGLAFWAAAAAGGGAGGAALGGVLTDFVSWRAVLLINVPIGLAMLIASARVLPAERTSTPGRLDLPGAITATAGVAAFVFGVTEASTAGWTSPLTLAPMLGGIALLAVFVLIESRFTKVPMLPLHLFRSRSVSVGNVLRGLAGATSLSMWYFLSLYLQHVLGYDPLQAGLAIVPFGLMLGGVSRATPRLLARYGPKRLITVGLLIGVVGFAWWSQSLTVGANYPIAVLLPGILASGSSGLIIAPITSVATTGVDARDHGAASGLVNTSQLTGGAIGLAVLATIAASQGAGGPHALAAGYDLALLIAAAILLAAAVVSVLTPTQSDRPAIESETETPAQQRASRQSPTEPSERSA